MGLSRQEISEGLMDSYELRLNYAQMTGDEKNAFRMREDGTEGYYYSDDAIMRAMDELDRRRFSERNVYTNAMQQFGPRAGIAMGRAMAMNSPYVANANARIDLQDALNAYSDGDYGQSLMSLGSAAQQGISLSPARRMGAAMGLVDFIRKVMK